MQKLSKKLSCKKEEEIPSVDNLIKLLPSENVDKIDSEYLTMSDMSTRVLHAALLIKLITDAKNKGFEV